MTKEQKMARENMVVLFKVGSHLYGTANEDSDEDYEGLFIETPEYMLGTKNITEIDMSTNKSNVRNVKGDVDYKLYSLKTFFHLAAKANPNKLEWFFIPQDNIVYESRFWLDIESNRHLFISKKLLHSFSGYAMSQRKKLAGKKRRYEEFCHFKKVLEDEIAKGTKRVGEMDIYENRSKKKYHDETDSVVEMKYKIIKGNYDWIKYYQTQEGADCIKINDKIYNWGMDIKTIYENISKIVDQYGHRTAGITQYGYDCKFAYNLFRIFDGAEEILKTGELTFPCSNAEFYKKIRNGEYILDELLDMSKDLDDKVHKIAESSDIPYKPDYKGIDKLQQKIYTDWWKWRKLI